MERLKVLANVCANSVLPLPVGPINNITFCNSTSSSLGLIVGYVYSDYMQLLKIFSFS